MKKKKKKDHELECNILNYELDIQQDLNWIRDALENDDHSLAGYWLHHLVSRAEAYKTWYEKNYPPKSTSPS